MKGRLVPILTCLVLTACAAGEDYNRPPVAIAHRWQLPPDPTQQADLIGRLAAEPTNPRDKAKASTPQLPPPPPVVQASAPDVDGSMRPSKSVVIGTVLPPYLSSPIWWERFGDAHLSQLMEKAKRDNYDLKVAQARIAEMLGNARTAGAALLPQVNLTGSTARSGFVEHTPYPIDTLSQVGLGLSWDIDIFGGDRRNIEAAADEVQATQADRDKTFLSLITDVATNYVQLRSLQQQHSLTLKNLEMQKDTLQVTVAQRVEGAISDLDVARAKAQVKSTASRIPQIDTATVAALNRISVLTGEAPTSISEELAKAQPIPSVPIEVVIATPVEAIEKRPDIQASERRLAESTALSGAALAQLYPKLTLSGFFGMQASQLYGYSTPLNAAASALMPLLDWGRIRGAIDASNARQVEAFYSYQQTVLLALEQIENALTAYINEHRRLDLLESAVVDQRKATEVAREQYKVGATTQLDLITAENSQLDSENDLTVSQATLASDLITLYTALGETYQPQFMTPPGAVIASSANRANDQTSAGTPLPPKSIIDDHSAQFENERKIHVSCYDRKCE